MARLSCGLDLRRHVARGWPGDYYGAREREPGASIRTCNKLRLAISATNANVTGAAHVLYNASASRKRSSLM